MIPIPWLPWMTPFGGGVVIVRSLGVGELMGGRVCRLVRLSEWIVSGHDRSKKKKGGNKIKNYI